jgi:tetratricopeptide (TPR) repeat protein
VAGRAGLVLVTGEAGIGKTVLATCAADAMSRAGATVLRTRCYEAERSLFLQPFTEMLGREPTSPEPEAPVAPELRLAGFAELQRRRVFESVSATIRTLAAQAPLVLLLDDLHNAGLATIELLHYLLRTLSERPLLVIATARLEEKASGLELLADLGIRLELGPLPPDAVHELVTAAGRPELAETILRQTRGHALYVVETLRWLGSGEAGVPLSLRQAVLARVQRAGPAVAELLRTAAVVAATLDPRVLSRMLGVDQAEVTRRCEEALTARLLAIAGREYEFANDLIRDVLYTTMPEPTRVAQHRRAAELLDSRPEAVADHAAAAGDWAHAARAYLVAGEQAADRFANDDANALVDRAMDAVSRLRSAGDGHAGDAVLRELVGRVHLARGRLRYRLRRHREALADFRDAARTAQEAGDQRLEMAALTELAGDVAVALGQPVDALPPALHRALRIAERLADRGAEAQIHARLAVLAANQLRLHEAVEDARRAVLAGRLAGDDRALANGLDGLKTAFYFLGDAPALEPVVAELEPLLRRLGDLHYLQWTVFESAVIPAAAGDWAEALRRIEAALDLNRRSGYLVHEPWFVAHSARVHRWRGDTEAALNAARRSVALVEEMPHSWWIPTTQTQLAIALLDTGDVDAARAALQAARSAVGPRGAPAHVAAATALLAQVSGSPERLAEAEAMLDAISAPPGGAWLHGAAAYLAVARTHIAAGDPARARTVLAPLVEAARRVPSVGELAEALLVDGTAGAALGDGDAATVLREAQTLAQRHHMPRIAAAARTALRTPVPARAELTRQRSSAKRAAARAAPSAGTGS